MTEFTTDIGTAFVYGIGFAAGTATFVLVVVALAVGITWWMDCKKVRDENKWP